MQNAVAAVVRSLSDTSRMHVIVVHGSDIFDVLCCLETHDLNSIKKGIRITEECNGSVPIRRRTFGEYSMELVVVEWPLHSRDKDICSLKTALRLVLNEACKDERQVDGATLVADRSVLEDPNFKRTFAGAFDEIHEEGLRPIAVIQNCGHDRPDITGLSFCILPVIFGRILTYTHYWLKGIPA